MAQGKEGEHPPFIKEGWGGLKLLLVFENILFVIFIGGCNEIIIIRIRKLSLL